MSREWSPIKAFIFVKTVSLCVFSFHVACDEKQKNEYPKEQVKNTATVVETLIVTGFQRPSLTVHSSPIEFGDRGAS